MVKDTEEHLAETKRLGPGYYRIRERYDYAIESDERYIEKLRKQIAEYDQAALNENQQVVLEWLKNKSLLTDIEPIELIWRLKVNSTKAGYRDMPVYKSYRYMTKAGQFQVLAAFAEWGMKEVTE